jgi:hypothetical protein
MYGPLILYTLPPRCNARSLVHLKHYKFKTPPSWHEVQLKLLHCSSRHLTLTHRPWRQAPVTWDRPISASTFRDVTFPTAIALPKKIRLCEVPQHQFNKTQVTHLLTPWSTNSINRTNKKFCLCKGLTATSSRETYWCWLLGEQAMFHIGIWNTQRELLPISEFCN